MLDVSIIIVTYNSEADIQDCLQSIATTKGSVTVETLIVDNHSHDGTVDIVRQGWSSARVIVNEQNVGFPAANNQAIPSAAGRYVLLLNPDTIALPGALEAMVRYMDEHPKCGVCGPRLIDANGAEAPAMFEPSILQAITRYGRITQLHRYILNEDDLIVSGSCLAFRRQLVSEVGLLDARLFWAEDVDFCIRARKRGYEVKQVPGATVVHKGGQSAKSNLQQTAYAQNATYVRMIRVHYTSYERTVLLSIRLSEICLRILKYSALAALPSRIDARQKVKGLLLVMRDMPALLLMRAKPKQAGSRINGHQESDRPCRDEYERSDLR